MEQISLLWGFGISSVINLSMLISKKNKDMEIQLWQQ